MSIEKMGGENLSERERDLPLDRMADAMGKKEKAFEAISEAAKLEVITRFVEKYPDHPINQEIVGTVMQMTVDAGVLEKLQKDLDKAMDGTVKSALIVLKLGLRLMFDDLVTNSKEDRRIDRIVSGTNNLYEKIKSQISPEDFEELAKGE